MQKFILQILVGAFLMGSFSAYAGDLAIPAAWDPLKPILMSRVSQNNLKMKLKPELVEGFSVFLKKLKSPAPQLMLLQNVLPKTTVELLMSVYSRKVRLEEAEKMAAYLQALVNNFQFQNPKAFDENTSHIIGRDWNEIDYSGEGMTWQKQKAFYQPYGIINFKSLEYLKKFFLVESKLPYFKKIYRPKNPDALL